jgi:hypothetical protein
MPLALALSGSSQVLSSGCVSGKHRTAAAAPVRSIQRLDADGMKALLGRRGGRQRPLIVYIFYTACRPCTDHFSDIELLFDRYHVKGLDVALVSIAPMDNAAKLLDALNHFNPAIPIFLLNKLDDEFAEEFLLRDWEPVVPSVFFYNSTGKPEDSEVDAESITYRSLQLRAEKLLRRSRKPKSLKGTSAS